MSKSSTSSSPEMMLPGPAIKSIAKKIVKTGDAQAVKKTAALDREFHYWVRKYQMKDLSTSETHQFSDDANHFYKNINIFGSRHRLRLWFKADNHVRKNNEPDPELYIEIEKHNHGSPQYSDQEYDPEPNDAILSYNFLDDFKLKYKDEYLSISQTSFKMYGWFTMKGLRMNVQMINLPISKPQDMEEYVRMIYNKIVKTLHEKKYKDIWYSLSPKTKEKTLDELLALNETEVVHIGTAVAKEGKNYKSYKTMVTNLIVKI